jgi:hypothetical protein
MTSSASAEEGSFLLVVHRNVELTLTQAQGSPPAVAQNSEFQLPTEHIQYCNGSEVDS